MKKALLVAEKPSVMNDIRKAYEKIKGTIPYDIDFGCCAGHLIGLCDPDEYSEEWGAPWKKDVLPMIPEEWKKKVVNPKFYSGLKEIWDNGNYDVVINAGDAGREGQLIQRLVYDELGVNVPVLRYWADDTTEKTIIKCLNNLVSDDNYKGLTDASYLRMYFDWLIGMNFSRAASLSLNRTTRIGRVLTPTLALVVKRENEILNFKPVDYYELVCNFVAKNGKYMGTLINPNSNDKSPSKYAYLKRDDLEKIKAVTDGVSTGTVTEIKEEDKVCKAPTLFNLSDLQKECSRKFGFTPAKTLNLAQNLYENHFLSYPRTESKCLTTEQAKEMPALVKKLGDIGIFKPFTDNILANPQLANRALKSKKYVDNSKVSDHPALTPTGDLPDLESLSQDEKDLYILVVCRFLSIFMPDNIITQTSVLTTVNAGGNDYVFRSTGSVEKQTGWKEILKLVAAKSTPKDTETMLPVLSPNESVNKGKGTINDKHTNPPKRYDDATIITAMETAGKQLDDKDLEQVLMDCAGLGTPATRAEILEKLFKYEYLERKAKTIFPTEQGMEYIRVLSGRTILSPELTAVWEKKLKEVETGATGYDDFYRAMIKYINSETASLLSLPAVGPYRKPIGKCPKCKRPFYSLSSFYACEGYFEKNGEERACDFGLPKKFGGKSLTETDAKQLINGEMIKPREYTWKNGNKSTTALVLKDFKISFPDAASQREMVGKCPVCGGRVVVGKTGYYCEEWNKKDENGNPSCEFSVFGKIGETQVTANHIREILEFGETKNEVNVKWKSGKSYPGKLTLEKLEDGKYRVSIKPFETRAIGKCPYCKIGTVYEEKFRYACNNTPSNGGSCLAAIPKKYCECNISPKNALALISGNTLKDMRLKSKKTGKFYTANLKTELDEERGLVVKIEFENKPDYKKTGNQKTAYKGGKNQGRTVKKG